MKISRTVWKMNLVMLVTGLVIIIGGIIASFSFPLLQIVPFSLGVMLTTIFNCFKAIWIEYTVNRVLSMNNESASSAFIRGQHFLRFLSTGVVLTAAVFLPFIDVLGAVLGIFTFNVGKYSLAFIVNTEDTHV